MNLRYTFILLLMFTLLSYNGQPPKNIESVTPKTFAKK